MHKIKVFFSKSVFLLGCLSLASCISVSLGGKKVTKAQGVAFVAPAPPYRSIPAKEADQAWQSQSSGNTLSFLSTCNDSSDPSMESILTDLLSSFDDPKSVNSHLQVFKGREALRATVAGEVDGVKTGADILIFKRNDCNYSISLVGVGKNVEADRPLFETFLTNFKAP